MIEIGFWVIAFVYGIYLLVDDLGRPYCGCGDEDE
jgi:hypothetical protein